MTSTRILPCGDSALTVEFGDRIDPVLNDRVMALDRRIAAHAIDGVIETVPTYRSLLVCFDPRVTSFDPLARQIAAMAETPPDAVDRGRHWRVPVVYGGASGADLDRIAEQAGLSTAEVIALHSAPRYRVYMLGFTPGFAYLGGLNERLATPRRPEPRPSTPSGTISIGGAQTAIQCLAGPSGWHLIGRTPVRTFSPERDPVFLIDAGDHISFAPIPEREWEALERDAAAGLPVAELIR